MNAEVERRRGLTFSQAESAEPLPSQLQRKELSQKLKALVWSIIHISANPQRSRSGMRKEFYLAPPWLDVLYYMHLHHRHQPVDTFSLESGWNELREDIISSNYLRFYGAIQAMVDTTKLSRVIKERIAKALETERAGFRLTDDVLVPVVTDEESEALKRALEQTRDTPLVGSRAHLKGAMRALTGGDWAGTVRESISAVESAVRTIEPANELATAINKLSKAGHIHPAMQEAFKKLYGYSSNEQGIRHALLDDGDAKVSEADALFMLGACASFVTYLTINAEKAGSLAD